MTEEAPSERLLSQRLRNRVMEELFYLSEGDAGVFAVLGLLRNGLRVPSTGLIVDGRSVLPPRLKVPWTR